MVQGVDQKPKAKATLKQRTMLCNFVLLPPIYMYIFTFIILLV